MKRPPPPPPPPPPAYSLPQGVTNEPGKQSKFAQTNVVSNMGTPGTLSDRPSDIFYECREDKKQFREEKTKKKGEKKGNFG